MEWILNDLSLEKNYTNLDDFSADILELLKARALSPRLASSLLCNRGLSSMEVSDGVSFINAVQDALNRDQRHLVLSWLDRYGPFWSDQRELNSDDYFEYQNEDVTDRGLGECSRRKISGKPITSVSLGRKFIFSPVEITHGLSEEPIGLVNVNNIWTITQLSESLESSEDPPTSWQALLDICSGKCPNLIFSSQLIEQITPLPFSSCVSDRFFELCLALDNVVASRDSNGKFTTATQELIQKYFHGCKAWFSDESDQDKIDFKHKLKFRDCYDGENKTFTYHGKIKTPQVRVYFEWPLEQQMEKIQIVYFGQKITKH